MKYLLKGSLTAVALVASSVLLSSPAAATITITTDQQTDQGAIVLLPVGQTGTMVQGNTQGGFVLNFTSTETLTTPSNGQARIEATDGELNDITITAADGSMFEFIEFNLFGQQGFDGTVTIVGIDQNGTEYDLVFGDDPNENLSGENFFFAATDELQSIKSISFSTTGGGFADLRQVRVGPAGMEAAIPEPGTWMMMLLGFAGIGGAVRRGRKQSERLLQIA